MSCCSIVVVLNAMHILVLLKRLVIFRVFEFMVSECGPDFLVIFYV